VPFSDPQYISVVIIGGGQAGLSASYCLRQRGVDDHVILEKHRIAHSWRAERWDSLSLVTPNHQFRLPGHVYSGDAPEGFMSKDQVTERIERYANQFKPPILEGITVTSVTKREGYFHLTTNQGSWFCDDVIVAIGGLHVPYIPRGAEQIPAQIQQLHSRDYKSPRLLPEGEVLVVGSGQSGVQIMEDLFLAGRKVHLCLGNAPRCPRRYRGRDVLTWLEEMGEFRRTRDESNPPPPEHYLTGREGGHEIDLREFASRGVKLYGFLDAISPDKITIHPDLTDKLDAADLAYNECCERIDTYIAQNEIDAPCQDHYQATWVPKNEPTELDFEENQIGSVIWCTGYQPDFKFIQLPVFTMRGLPETERGVTALPGLYFLGLPWMHTWGSARFSGIAEDADFIAAQIQASIPECIE
jgi:putative flavoprotein involved in K+ transport